jgi:hypothetical protein
MLSIHPGIMKNGNTRSGKELKTNGFGSSWRPAIPRYCQDPTQRNSGRWLKQKLLMSIQEMLATNLR